MSTLLTILGTAGIVAPTFYVLGAVMAKGAQADELADANEAYRQENDFANLNVKAKNDAITAHARAVDALATKQARIDRALACETPKAAHGVRKMARILRGEQGA